MEASFMIQKSFLMISSLSYRRDYLMRKKRAYVRRLLLINVDDLFSLLLALTCGTLLSENSQGTLSGSLMMRRIQDIIPCRSLRNGRCLYIYTALYRL